MDRSAPAEAVADAETTGTSSSTSGSGAQDEAGDACTLTAFKPVAVAPNLMFVVEASGSMTRERWDHDLDPATEEVTLWSSLHASLAEVMDAFGPNIYAGIQRFPSEDACDPAPCHNIYTACRVEETPEAPLALANGQGVLAAIPGAGVSIPHFDYPTPATAAIGSSLEHLLARAGQRRSHVVLVLDGAANCGVGLEYPEVFEEYDEQLPLVLANAYANEDIATYIVGLEIADELIGTGVDGRPETNPFERLNELALAGGVPKSAGLESEKFYNAHDEVELGEALDTILDDLTTCVVNLELEGSLGAEQLDHLTLRADGIELPFVEDCENHAGWTWADPDQLRLRLCGSSCASFKRSEAMFEGEFGCGP